MSIVRFKVIFFDDFGKRIFDGLIGRILFINYKEYIKNSFRNCFNIKMVIGYLLDGNIIELIGVIEIRNVGFFYFVVYKCCKGI